MTDAAREENRVLEEIAALIQEHADTPRLCALKIFVLAAAHTREECARELEEEARRMEREGAPWSDLDKAHRFREAARIVKGG